MIRNLILISIMLLSLLCCAHYRPDRWDEGEVAMAGALTVSMAVDYLQTSRIARNPEQFRETNFTLGEHPSTGAVNLYFPVMLGVELGVAHFLPGPWRKAWLGFLIGMEITAIVTNERTGIRP